jgi:signal transduction histidine kinase
MRELSSRLLAALEDQRQRIARELHDNVGSSLGAIKLVVDGLLATANQGGGVSALSLSSLISILQGTMREVRRISMDLRPSTLDDLGLITTIDWYLREFQTACPNTNVEQRLELAETDVPDALKIHLFRLLQEGLSHAAERNVASRIRVHLRREDDTIVLEIEDSGVGNGPVGGIGTISMRERAQIAGGVLSILRTPGKGTRIRAQFPITHPNSGAAPARE